MHMDPFLISRDLLCRVCVLSMSVLFQLRITVPNIYEAECVRNHREWNHEAKALVPSFRARPVSVKCPVPFQSSSVVIAGHGFLSALWFSFPLLPYSFLDLSFHDQKITEDNILC